MVRASVVFSLASIAVLLSLTSTASAAEYLTGIDWKEPVVVTPGETNRRAPSDAVVLFDGTDLSAWSGAEKWKVEDGAMVVGKGFIRTKQAFGDCQLHIEWSAPTPVKGKGQGRGNSGVFFGIPADGPPGFIGYEIQVLDSYQNKTYFDGQAAGIYKQTPPMVNATRPPGEWNTYDIFWTAPRFNEDGTLRSPAFMTAMHNGVLVLNHFELLGDTPYNRPPAYKAHAPRGSIGLQDHNNPVRFRNIWVREIKPAVGEKVREPNMPGGRVPKPAPPNGSVSGKVAIGGKPLAGGTVTFSSTIKGTYSTTVGDDGSFRLTLPHGKYTIVLKAKEAAKREKGASPVANKSGAEKTSGLQVEVQDSETEIVIELVN